MTAQDIINGNCPSLVLWHFEVFKNTHHEQSVEQLASDFAAGIRWRAEQFGESAEAAAFILATIDNP